MLNPIEPVSIEQFKEHARISGSGESFTIELYLATAREQVEAFTGRDYISKIKEATYTFDQVTTIPVADILSVSGYYTDVTEVAEAYNYFVEYQKGISINRQHAIDLDNLPTYTVRYQLEVDPAQIPATIKTAILKYAAELYENRETTTTLPTTMLPVNYQTMLLAYKKEII
jgi:hypothetical protein